MLFYICLLVLLSRFAMGRNRVIDGAPGGRTITPNICNHFKTINIRKESCLPNFESWICGGYRKNRAPAHSAKMSFKAITTVCRVIVYFCLSFLETRSFICLDYIERCPSTTGFLTTLTVTSDYLIRLLIACHFDSAAQTFSHSSHFQSLS